MSKFRIPSTFNIQNIDDIIFFKNHRSAERGAVSHALIQQKKVFETKKRYVKNNTTIIKKVN